MEKKILPGLSPQERLETLENSADRVENFRYTKPFTNDQLTVFKDQLSVTMIDLNVIEEEFRLIKEEYKAKMKPLKDETKALLLDIRNKAESITEKCFIFIEENSVGYYNSNGDLVYERPLLPREKQKTIFQIKREGTND